MNLTKRIADLSPEKRAFLELLLKEKGVNLPGALIIPRRNESTSLLSYAQQRLWFIDQLMPGTTLYNIPSAVRLGGALNIAALHRSFNEVIRRHETLRTTFFSVDGQPQQLIAPTLDLSIPLVDLSNLPAEERDAEAQRLARLEAQRPFDLAAGPLLRVHLLRLAAEEHVVLLTMQHIISDGWSMNVLIQEISTLYSAYSEGSASPLEELPVQYADYARWQRQHLSGEVLDEQLQYWIQQLGGAEMLELPTDRPRPAVQSYRGSTISYALSRELSERLKALSQREGTTLFMTLLAAWQVLLMRYSGQSDISVGTPVAGRTRAEVEPLIGFFVNTLVLRTGMAREWSFREALQRVREVCLGGYAHQEVPFEMLVERLQPARSLSHAPLFQVMFLLNSASTQSGKGASQQSNTLEISGSLAKFDLSLAVAEKDGNLIAALEYSADLFDEETISRMLRHYETLLKNIASSPTQCISEIPLLSGEEKQRLLVDCNRTAVNYPDTHLLHSLIEAQVERTPDAVALIFEDRPTLLS